MACLQEMMWRQIACWGDHEEKTLATNQTRERRPTKCVRLSDLCTFLTLLEPSKHAPAWLTSADACQLPGCLAGSGPRGQGTRMDGPSHWHSHTQMAHSVSRLHIKMGGALTTGNDESAIFHLLPLPFDTCGGGGHAHWLGRGFLCYTTILKFVSD